MITDNKIILKEVLKIRRKQSKAGVKKLHKTIKPLLLDQGISIGRDWLFAFLRKKKLLVYRKKKYVSTTQSNHRFKKYSNLIKDLEIIEPNHVFVSDITYINTFEGFCYLFLITDVYSRKIVGYDLNKSLGMEGAIKSLKMALKYVSNTGKLIHHSDRGIQYCSNVYTNILNKYDIKISMTEDNHVYENALAERVNGILKDEFLLGEKLSSIKTAKLMTKEAIKIYNEERLHMSLGYITPNQKYAA